MAEKYQALVKRLDTIIDLRNAASLLSYDQETAMPKKGASARARQLATLSKLAHEMVIADETGQLLQDAHAELNGADYESDEAAMVRVAQILYDESTRIPADFQAEYTRTVALAHDVWVEARQQKDFAIFRDTLAQIIDMTRQRADYLGYDETPYDALLNQYERGATTAQVKAIFDAHKPHLVDLIAAISDAPQVDDSVLRRSFDTDKQRRFAREIVQAFGFDYASGADAEAVHPFCTNFSVNDVRITNRYDPNFINTALFGMMHEAGHGMYEQGVAQQFDGTVLGSGTSLGVHESQSRLWENLVGRSKGFWSWAFPKLQMYYPNQLMDVDLDTFYKAINKVDRSFIRVEADEATYNLHIMLRFEIEIDMMAGRIAVDDLPDVWNSKFEDYFGLTPPNDALGVLQDVHWSAGLIGYFSTYALGNMLSVQYYNQAVQAHPSIPDDIANGKFDTLLQWLRTNIHTHGRKFTSQELTQRITGETMQSEPYMSYLKAKYGEIYGL